MTHSNDALQAERVLLALTVDCPWCYSKAGQRCVRTVDPFKGEPFDPNGGIHTVRIDRAYFRKDSKP